MTLFIFFINQIRKKSLYTPALFYPFCSRKKSEKEYTEKKRYVPQQPLKKKVSFMKYNFLFQGKVSTLFT